ncbi:unnamed protein product [Diatraea saccharalis]|uniref:Uncharacterized protein n=1 Tax=Diatraea saccharalis TaxID=40085 RepID=A0A9N9N1F8_9NEOP|nr:unnamed protein product [Diatraea saccharalis]
MKCFLILHWHCTKRTISPLSYDLHFYETVVIISRPVNDNRASLLSRGPTLPRKPEKERDGYMQVWKYYMTMAYLVVPAVPSPVIRCASPDLSLR